MFDLMAIASLVAVAHTALFLGPSVSRIELASTASFSQIRALKVKSVHRVGLDRSISDLAWVGDKLVCYSQLAHNRVGLVLYPGDKVVLSWMAEHNGGQVASFLPRPSIIATDRWLFFWRNDELCRTQLPLLQVPIQEKAIFVVANLSKARTQWRSTNYGHGWVHWGCYRDQVLISITEQDGKMGFSKGLDFVGGNAVSSISNDAECLLIQNEDNDMQVWRLGNTRRKVLWKRKLGGSPIDFSMSSEITWYPAKNYALVSFPATTMDTWTVVESVDQWKSVPIIGPTVGHSVRTVSPSRLNLSKDFELNSTIDQPRKVGHYIVFILNPPGDYQQSELGFLNGSYNEVSFPPWGDGATQFTVSRDGKHLALVRNRGTIDKERQELLTLELRSVTR